MAVVEVSTAVAAEAFAAAWVEVAFVVVMVEAACVVVTVEAASAVATEVAFVVVTEVIEAATVAGVMDAATVAGAVGGMDLAWASGWDGEPGAGRTGVMATPIITDTPIIPATLTTLMSTILITRLIHALPTAHTIAAFPGPAPSPTRLTRLRPDQTLDPIRRRTPRRASHRQRPISLSRTANGTTSAEMPLRQ